MCSSDLFARPMAGSALGGRMDRFGLAFAAVLALLVVNQVAFNAYVAGAHGGRTDFFGRVFPPIFFSRMALDAAPVQALLHLIPDPHWLAPSALRVQAVLELPFAVFAYVSVARLVDRATARQIAAGPLGILVCVAYTLTLSAIEVVLWNRYTVDDLVLRGVGLVLTVPVLRALAGPPVQADVPSARRLLFFVVGLGAMSAIVLAFCYIALLYNLGALVPLALPIAISAVAYTICTVPAPTAATTSWLLRFAFAFGRRFTLLFAAPALAVRYALSHSRGEAGALAAVAIVTVLAVVLAAADELRALPVAERRRWVIRALAGLVLASVFAPLDPAAHGPAWARLPDLRTIQAALLAGAGFTLGWALVATLDGARRVSPAP